MGICCILFTLTLSYQVNMLKKKSNAFVRLQKKNELKHSPPSADLIHDHKQPFHFFLCFSQNSSPVIPYLSLACVFAFILSFGLGPGNKPNLSLLSQNFLSMSTPIKGDIYFFLSCKGGVTNILTTELFTQTARPAAYVVAGSINWLSFFFISMVFPFIVVSVQT